MTCHFGFTEHHAVFVTLHVAVLIWFLRASSRSPPLLRALVCSGSAVTWAYHLILAAACVWPWASATLHANYEMAGAKLRLLHFAVFDQAMLGFVAARTLRINGV